MNETMEEESTLALQPEQTEQSNEELEDEVKKIEKLNVEIVEKYISSTDSESKASIQSLSYESNKNPTNEEIDSEVRKIEQLDLETVNKFMSKDQSEMSFKSDDNLSNEQTDPKQDAKESPQPVAVRQSNRKRVLTQKLSTTFTITQPSSQSKKKEKESSEQPIKCEPQAAKTEAANENFGEKEINHEDLVECVIQGKTIRLTQSDMDKFTRNGKWAQCEFFRFDSVNAEKPCKFCRSKCKTVTDGVYMCSLCRHFAHKSLVKHHMFVCKMSAKDKSGYCEDQEKLSQFPNNIFCRYCHFHYIISSLPSLNRLHKYLVSFVNNRIIYINSVSKKTMLWKSRLALDMKHTNTHSTNGNVLNSKSAKSSTIATSRHLLLKSKKKKKESLNRKIELIKTQLKTSGHLQSTEKHTNDKQLDEQTIVTEKPVEKPLNTPNKKRESVDKFNSYNKENETTKESSLNASQSTQRPSLAELYLDSDVTSSSSQRTGPRVKHVSRYEPKHLSMFNYKLYNKNLNADLSTELIKNRHLIHLKLINDDFTSIRTNCKSFVVNDLKPELNLSALSKDLKDSIYESLEISRDYLLFESNEQQHQRLHQSNVHSSKSDSSFLIYTKKKQQQFNRTSSRLNESTNNPYEFNLNEDLLDSSFQTDSSLNQSRKSSTFINRKHSHALLSKSDSKSNLSKNFNNKKEHQPSSVFNWEDYFERNHKISTNQNTRYSSFQTSTNAEIGSNSDDIANTCGTALTKQKSSTDLVTEPALKRNVDMTKKRFNYRLHSYKDRFHPYDTAYEAGEKYINLDKNFFKKHSILNTFFNSFTDYKSVGINQFLKRKSDPSSLMTNITHKRRHDPNEKYLSWDLEVDYDLLELWKHGLAVFGYETFNLKSICYICASASSDEHLLYCNVCCEPFHEFCLDDYERPKSNTNLLDWVCPACKFCEICKMQNKLLYCHECDNCFHANCFKKSHYPKKPSKKAEIWVCYNCFQCRTCQSKEIFYDKKLFNRSSNYDFSLCFKCFDKAQKANNEANKTKTEQEKATECLKLPNGHVIGPDKFSSDEDFELLKRVLNQSELFLPLQTEIQSEESKPNKLQLLISNFKSQCGNVQLSAENILDELKRMKNEYFLEFLNEFNDSIRNELTSQSEQHLDSAVIEFSFETNKSLPEVKEQINRLEKDEQTVRVVREIYDKLRQKFKLIDFEQFNDEKMRKEQQNMSIKQNEEEIKARNANLTEKKQRFFDELSQRPHDDHSYAVCNSLLKSLLNSNQVLERFDTLHDLLKEADDKRKKLEELILFENLISEQADERQCLVCGVLGDDRVCGRLLPVETTWIHINCLIWSSEVFIKDYLVEQIQSMLTRSKSTMCKHCAKEGASVKCFEKKCDVSFHFGCAFKAKCLFIENIPSRNKKSKNTNNKSKTSDECINDAKSNDENNFNKFFIYCTEHRKGYAHLEEPRLTECFDAKKNFIVDLRDETFRRKNPVPQFSARNNEFHMMVGSLQVTHLGEIDTISDFNDYLCPINYTSSRLYWSTSQIGKKCLYTCRIKHKRDVQANSSTTAQTTNSQAPKKPTTKRTYTPRDTTSSKINQTSDQKANKKTEDALSKSEECNLIQRSKFDMSVSQLSPNVVGQQSNMDQIEAESLLNSNYQAYLKRLYGDSDSKSSVDQAAESQQNQSETISNEELSRIKEPILNEEPATEPVKQEHEVKETLVENEIQIKMEIDNFESGESVNTEEKMKQVSENIQMSEEQKEREKDSNDLSMLNQMDGQDDQFNQSTTQQFASNQQAPPAKNILKLDKQNMSSLLNTIKSGNQMSHQQQQVKIITNKPSVFNVIPNVLKHQPANPFHSQPFQRSQSPLMSSSLASKSFSTASASSFIPTTSGPFYSQNQYITNHNLTTSSMLTKSNLTNQQQQSKKPKVVKMSNIAGLTKSSGLEQHSQFSSELRLNEKFMNKSSLNDRSLLSANNNDFSIISPRSDKSDSSLKLNNTSFHILNPLRSSLEDTTSTGHINLPVSSSYSNTSLQSSSSSSNRSIHVSSNEASSSEFRPISGKKQSKKVKDYSNAKPTVAALLSAVYSNPSPNNSSAESSVQPNQKIVSNSKMISATTVQPTYQAHTSAQMVNSNTSMNEFSSLLNAKQTSNSPFEQTQQTTSYLNKGNNKNEIKKSNKKKIKTPTKSPNKLKDYFLNETQESQTSGHQFPFSRFDSSSNVLSSNGVFYPGHIRAPVFQNIGSSSFFNAAVSNEFTPAGSLLTGIPSQITPFTNKKLANKLLKRNKKFIKDLETNELSNQSNNWPQFTTFEPDENLNSKKNKKSKNENLDNDDENENVPSKTKMSRRKNAKNLLSSANYHINSVAKAEKDELVFEITNEEGLCVQAKDINKAWKTVIDKVNQLRQESNLKTLSYSGTNGITLYGLNNRAIVYMLEQFDTVQFCASYKNKYIARSGSDENWIIDPKACARGKAYTGAYKKCLDPFHWLSSKYRDFTYIVNRFDQPFLQAAKALISTDLNYAMKYRHLKEFSKNGLVVKNSTIQGRGLFTLVDLYPGQMIIEYSGEIIRAELCDKREKYYESRGIGCYMFRIDDLEVIDATTKGNQARFINHSCDPNCLSKVIVVQGQKHIIIFAQRFISKGEELTYDYKFPKEDVKIECLCKSSKCRKYLN